MKWINTTNICVRRPDSRQCFRGLLQLLILVTLVGCFPNPDADDEGHATFSREAIPVLLGRRASGVDEVEVVADIAELLGRDTAVDMLMKDSAFVDHWADRIVDILEVQRQNQGGIGVAADAACWGEPTRANPDPAIAEWVRDNDPRASGAPTPAWNMTDLVRSAIVLDDLSPIFRANLLTTSMRRAGSDGRTTELTNYLMRVYLNRNTDCLGCHNPEQSTSNKTDINGNIIWRRLWNVPGHPEKALLGNYLSGSSAFARVRPIMRGDVRQPAGGLFGSRPWGMNNSCLTDTNRDTPQNNGDVTHGGFRVIPAGSPNNPDAGFGSLDGSTNGKLSVWELEAAFRQGVLDLQDGYERTQPTTASHPAGSDEDLYCGFVEAVQNKCTTCHRAGGVASFLMLDGNDPAQELFDQGLVLAGNVAGSTLWQRIDGGGMPPAGQPQLTIAQKNDIQNWIAGNAPNPADVDICTASKIPDVEPDEAFAFLTASNFVDGVWASVMGYPLTIEHGFPRNKDQMHLLWNLTEHVFVKNDWSLKSTLRKMLTSRWFARRAPNLSQQGSAYELPENNPWFAADPSLVANPPAHQKRNGQGELVNMYRVNTVLRNISGALGWKEPKRFPPASTNSVDYPYPLDVELGQYLSPALPGFEGVNFQSLLALESRLGSAGSCDKSGRSEDADDWINALNAAIEQHNNDNPLTPITVGEAFAIVKDRLIQDTTIESVLPSSLRNVPDAKTEEQAVVAFFQVGVSNPLTIHSPTTDLTLVQLEQKLRQACNTVIKSPEFLLPNVSPRGYSDNNMPDPPALSVCLPGERCGYPKACGKWSSTLRNMGQQPICEDRTIRKGVRFLFPYPGTLVGNVVEIDPNKWLTKKPLFESTLKQAINQPVFMFDANKERNGSNKNRIGPVFDSAENLRANSNVSMDPSRTAEVVRNASRRASAEAEERTPKTQKEVLNSQSEDYSSPSISRVDKRRDRVAKPQFPGLDVNLVKDLTVMDVEKEKPTRLFNLDRVKQRLSTMCLQGLCGFQVQAGLKQCLSKESKAAGCNRLRSTCDPRCQDGFNCCGTPPTDASRSGVLTIWAEGALVREARGVRVLPLGARRWQPLKVGVTLRVGDLLDVPLKATLAIQSGNVLYGDRGVDAEKQPFVNHLISVTGPSAEKIVQSRLKKNTLHPKVIARGVRSGEYLSKGVSRGDWKRILARQPKPEHNEQPNEKQDSELLNDFESQHRGMKEIKQK